MTRKIAPLRKFEALQARSELQNGSNRPMIATCIDLETHQPKECVIKFTSGERMWPGACMAEVLAIWIAREWKIWSVDPVVVVVTEEFVESMRGHDLFAIAKKSIGENFGSIYEPGMMDFPINSEIAPSLMRQAQKVFAFDVFIDNPDRNFRKPNCGILNNNILVFDHEMAFAFSRLLFTSSLYEPCNLNEEESVIGNSVFLPSIKGHQLSVSEIEQCISSIDESFWNDVVSMMPICWMVDSFESIRKNLSAVVSNRDSFVECIKSWVI